MPPLSLTILRIDLWILLLGSFAVGSIPFGYIVARAHGMDIRDVGSGNIGMTNVWRALGWKAGLTVLLLDLLKGFIPVLLVKLQPGPAQLGTYEAMFTGLAAVLGHTFTPWLRFKGGKGIATGGGVLIALLGVWSLVPVGVFGICLAITRMVSASSLLAAYSAAAVCAVIPQLRLLLVLTMPLALFVTWTHRENISRILNGTERKVGGKKREEAAP